MNTADYEHCGCMELTLLLNVYSSNPVGSPFFLALYELVDCSLAISVREGRGR